MKAGYPIRIVEGNYFRIAQPLEKITWEGVTRQKVDYVPDDGDKISVCLVGKYSRHNIVNVSIEGNLLKWDCNGAINTGSYGVEVTVTCADGRNLRSYQRDRIQIVNSNEEAGITSGDEFDVDTYEISGAVLLYVKGDQGYSAYEVAVQNGFEGSVEEWLESLKGADGTMHFDDLTPAQKEGLKGDKGDTGVGIASIVQTQTSTESDGENIVEVTMNDNAQNPTKYQFSVHNGAQGNQGLSAYEVYCSTVPEGQQPMSLNDWLASLIGKSAYQVYYDAAVAQGLTPMSQNEWIASLKGERGIGIANITEQASEENGGTNTVTVTMDDDEVNPTTYELHVKNGAKGDQGDAGKSAYQEYLDTLEEGDTELTPEQWLASLKGQKGDTGPQGSTVIIGNEQTYQLFGDMGQSAEGAMTQKAVTDLFGNYVDATDVVAMLDPD